MWILNAPSLFCWEVTPKADVRAKYGAGKPYDGVIASGDLPKIEPSVSRASCSLGASSLKSMCWVLVCGVSAFNPRYQCYVRY